MVKVELPGAVTLLGDKVSCPASAGCDVAADELLLWCRPRLGGVKTPKSVDFRADLPRSARGKILRRVLREPHWAGRERKV